MSAKGGEGLDAVTAEWEQDLSPDEAARWLDAPFSVAEREDVLSLVRWFRRRYPTPLERLAYVRRAYARWQSTLGLARPSESRKQP